MSVYVDIFQNIFFPPSVFGLKRYFEAHNLLSPPNVMNVLGLITAADQVTTLLSVISFLMMCLQF